ncbi:E3 SUMO-protein ligase ZBED1 isoform X2 [Conger conger]|uniref:E3 SUMO-protein ligase ZBED1 isoform X2 n=1 Tax=Conger conger TaxID=82655 RepID=UPI002A59BD10|nr:E3 SUMO-protein ligase ZBED1 isoform X2 [Conger conger]
MIARVLEQIKAISQEFTDALSGEEYISISYLKPILHLLAASLLAEDDEDTDLSRSIKTKVLAYLKEKYSDPDTQELLDVASFLDPRFKIQYIRADHIPAIKTRLKTEMEQSARQEKRSRTETVSKAQSAKPSAEKAKKSLCSFFKTSVASPALLVQLDNVVEAELNTYLFTPAIDGEENPLAWWKLHKINFPQLSKLARKYLCVPATSSPSERLFSTGGNIVTCTRSSLKPAKVDMLVFLAKNI